MPTFFPLPADGSLSHAHRLAITAQFIIMIGTTQNWIMGDRTAHIGSANQQSDTGVSAAAPAGFNTATSSNPRHDTTQLINGY